MAIRQMRLFEVIIGERVERNSEELILMMLNLSPKAFAYLNSLRNRFQIFGATSSSELNKATMFHLISVMRDNKLTNWGEIFSADVLSHVAVIADLYNTRFKIRYVRQDILANYKNDGSFEAEPSTSPLSIVQRLVRGHLIAVW